MGTRFEAMHFARIDGANHHEPHVGDQLGADGMFDMAFKSSKDFERTGGRGCSRWKG